MKRWIVLLLVLGLTSFAACNDDDNSTNPNDNDNNHNTHNGTITARVTGDYTLNFACTTGYGLALNEVQGQGTGSMHIQGPFTVGGDTYLIDIQIYENPGTGTFEFVFPPVNAVGSIGKNSTGNFSESGSVTVTEATSSRLKGTFSFTAFRIEQGIGKVTVTVSNGTFDVPVILEG